MEPLDILAAGNGASIPQPQTAHEYADILGIRVSAVDMEHAVEMAGQWIDSGRPGYACLCGVHGVMEAQRDPELRRIFNRATFNLPDGMPMSWVGWQQGYSAMNRVFGPDFMIELCQLSSKRGYRNFLYGGKPGVAAELADRLRRRIPGLKIIGTFTPPFRQLTADEEQDLFAKIARAKPHIVWVGLSTPKQERFMAQYLDRLQVPLLAGVGAAFDYHTGRIRDCPAWVKRAGLQWVHRLLQDPRRLWKRYLRSNSGFLWRLALQKLRS